jgi:hypothetical protein
MVVIVMMLPPKVRTLLLDGEKWPFQRMTMLL